MRGTSCLRGLAIFGVALGVTMAPGATTSDLLGISSAKAEKFYTRKRVNGQWITGMFPADETAPTRRATPRPKPIARAKPAVVAALGTAATAVATKSDTSPSQAAEAAPVRETGLAFPPAPVRTEWASVPAQTVPANVQPALPPEARPSSDTTSTSAAPAADERLSRLRSALLVRAQDLAAKSPETPAAPAPMPEKTGAALAKTMPDPTRTDALAEPAKNGTKLEPRSVSYDFESGVKTTVFANSVVREPFDVASIKRIALPNR